jgi:hypothetical protein
MSAGGGANSGGVPARMEAQAKGVGRPRQVYLCGGALAVGCSRPRKTKRAQFLGGGRDGLARTRFFAHRQGEYEHSQGEECEARGALNFGGAIELRAELRIRRGREPWRAGRDKRVVGVGLHPFRPKGEQSGEHKTESQDNGARPTDRACGGRRDDRWAD